MLESASGDPGTGMEHHFDTGAFGETNSLVITCSTRKSFLRSMKHLPIKLVDHSIYHTVR
jgi:hypothetical protein